MSDSNTAPVEQVNTTVSRETQMQNLLESNQMQTRMLFGIPVFRRKFERHEELKAQTLEFFKDKENFRSATSRDTLLFTDANLHRLDLFKPYADFIVESLKIVMDATGFEPSIALTGLWGTVHPEGGFHHRHTHYNSFLAGVYYLDGTPQSSGTSFFNPMQYHNIIVPKFKDRRMHNAFSTVTMPFEEGTLIIFPAWLSHNTSFNNINRTNAYRKILSFNSMPVGTTNCDIYDRYTYSDVSNDEGLPHAVNHIVGRENFNQWDIVDNSPYFKQFETKEEGQ